MIPDTVDEAGKYNFSINLCKAVDCGQANDAAVSYNVTVPLDRDTLVLNLFYSTYRCKLICLYSFITI